MANNPLNRKSPPILSKSKYLAGLQCPKLLWINVNSKERIPEVDEARQHIFDEGNAVGEYAKKLFPDGIDIEDEDIAENLRKTQELIKLEPRRTLFEAAFSPEGERIYSRADILEPQRDGSWDIVEVKSSTKVKDVNIFDVAFQKYVYEKAGLKINNCFILHINSEYVRHGEIEMDKLFAREEVSDKVEKEIKNVPGNLKIMLEVVDSNEPIVKIGDFCNKPYECALKGECWNFLPEHNVFDLYYGGKKSAKLLEEGIVSIKDIPDGYELTDKQIIQQYCAKNGEVHVNKKNIDKFIKKLRYPLHFLDFETFQTTIPIYDNQSPYQQIPFQFSLHIIEKKGQKPEHHYFLAEGSEDPRKEFLNQLEKIIGKDGSVIVYNQGFEQGVLEDLVEVFPKEKESINAIIERMVDLLMPFRNFDYYDCKQQGSASLKDVLPALTGKSYEGMEISAGGDASLQFFYSAHGVNGKKASPQEVKKIRKDLLEYCALDTMAMIWILEKLESAIE